MQNKLKKKKKKLPRKPRALVHKLVLMQHNAAGFPHVPRAKIKPYNRLRCTWRTCDSISFIDSALRLSSAGCLGDSLCEAQRGAASSVAYMKPLEVNFPD